MITATTIAGPRGAAAGANAATPGPAGGLGLDFSALMGGVLADAAVPPVPDAAVAAADPFPTSTVADSAPVAIPSAPSLTVSLPDQPVPDPVLMPVTPSAVVLAPAEPPVGALPLPQALACLVEVETGGRRRSAVERDADAPIVEEEKVVAPDARVVPPDALSLAPVATLAPVAVPLPVSFASQGSAQADPSVPAAGLIMPDRKAEIVDPRSSAMASDQAPEGAAVAAPSPALVAWQVVSQPASRDRAVDDASDQGVKGALSGTKRVMAALSAQPGKKAETAPFDDARIVGPVAVAAEAATARMADRATVAVAQGAGQSPVTTRSDAIVPVAADGQAVVAPAPVAAQAMASPVVAQAGVAMPPAMAMLHDISALLAEPVADAQPVPVVAPTPVAVPVVASAVAAAQPAAVATAATEPSRQGRRRDGAGGVVETARSVDGGIAAPVSVTAATPAPTIQPTHVAGAVSVADLQPNGGMSAIPADAALGFHVDAARHGQELDQVARDIAATGQAGAPLSFKLDSHRLGSVAVELTQQAAGLHVRFESGDATARTILADQQQQLVTDARAAGVRIAETSVEAPRRDDAASTQSGTAPRSDPSAGQTANGQSQGGQAGGQRGQGQPAQPAPTWSRGTRTGQPRTEQPAVTPRELYA